MADMINVTRAGPEVMADNEDYNSMPNEVRLLDPALKTRSLSAQQIFMIGVLSLIGMVILIAITAITRVAMCWDLNEGTMQCTAANGFFWLSVSMLVVVPVTVLVRYVWTSVATTKTTNARAMISRDQFGNPVDVQLLQRMDMNAYLHQFNTNIQASVLKAPYQTLPKGLNAYSTHNASTNNAPTAQPLALPDSGGIDVGPMEVSAWLDLSDEWPHIMLVAKTGGGKSTTAKAILAHRIQGGDEILIIDPHASVWFDLKSHGGANKWDEVVRWMDNVSAECQRRLEIVKERTESGKETSPSHFPRLTVLLDEANTCKDTIESLYTKKNSPWLRFVQGLGSGARKVNISLIVVGQSALLEDLGITGGMRENFTRICLDDRSINQLISSDEPDLLRKQALRSALKTHRYPAVTVIDSEAFLLSRDGLNEIEAPNTKGAEWLPPAECSSVRPSEECEEAEYDLFSDLLGQADERTELSEDDKVARLADLIQQGETRETIRDNDLAPFTWTNKLYTAAKSRVSTRRET